MNVDESSSEFAQQQTLEKRNEIPETTSSSYLISYKPAGAEFSNVARQDREAADKTYSLKPTNIRGMESFHIVGLMMENTG